MLTYAKRIIAASVECLVTHPAKVPHTWQRDSHDPIQEFVHALASYRQHHPDWHSLAQLEIRNCLACASYDRLLAGNLLQFVQRRIKYLDVLTSLAHGH